MALAAPVVEPEMRDRAGRGIGAAVMGVPAAVLQVMLALGCTLPALRLVRPLLARPSAGAAARLIRLAIALAVAIPVTLLQVLPIGALVFFAGLQLYFLMSPSAREGFDFQRFFESEDTGPMLARTGIQSVFIILNVLIDRIFLNSFAELSPDLPVLRAVLRVRLALTRVLVRVGSTMILMGLSLLPLSALLLALPAVNPSEAVLADVVAPTRSRWRLFGRRAFGLVTFSVTVLALVAFSTEVVSRLGLSGGTYFGTLARSVLPARLVDRLPTAMIEQWPYVVMLVYVFDLAILVLIGRVPLQYNVRNLVVRWPITGMTAAAFLVVVAMLTVMLAFVTGMTKTTGESGFPGNVLVMSDGATDELFSNLAYGNVDNLESVRVTLDENDEPLPTPVTVKQVKGRGTRKVYLASRETYCVINQQIPGSNRRRFIQLRILVDPEITAAVHNISLLQGEWFESGKLDDQGRVPCVVGEGVAGTLGEDLGKKRIDVGDTFELGDMTWVVVGIARTKGTTYGSEVWCSNVNVVTRTFGKESYTTLVLRAHDDSEPSARALAYHLRNRYAVQKLKAVVETQYFADLNKSSTQFLNSIIFVAIVMAIGGVFCVMITMFSAIAQRTKDIGILRLLGFKRWQVLVSFLLESMGIAVIGGLLGLALGYACDGFSVTSIASSGPGGGKSVSATLIVNRDVVLVSLLFTLVMGRLGGLVPALSAMRLQILESLR